MICIANLVNWLFPGVSNAPHSFFNGVWGICEIAGSKPEFEYRHYQRTFAHHLMVYYKK